MNQKIIKMNYKWHSDNKPGCLLSPFPYNIWGPSQFCYKSKKRKGVPIGKREVKLSFFTDDIIFYIVNSKASTE